MPRFSPSLSLTIEIAPFSRASPSQIAEWLTVTSTDLPEIQVTPLTSSGTISVTVLFTDTQPVIISPTSTPPFTPDPNPAECIRSAAPVGSLSLVPSEVGFVRWVTDGDTIVVEIDGKLHSVRYLGIDAPVDQPIPQYLGPTATRLNHKLVDGELVEMFKDGANTDRFGQLLRYVVVRRSGIFANYELVRQGLARAEAVGMDISTSTVIATLEQTGQACASKFHVAEQAARVENLGLWNLAAYFTPTVIRFTPVSPTASLPPGTALPATSTSVEFGTLPAGQTPETATPTPTGTITVTATFSGTLTATTTVTPGTQTGTLTPSPTETLTPSITSSAP